MHPPPRSRNPSEALRKLLRSGVIVKLTLRGWSKFAQHQMNIAELNPRGGRFGFALVIFAVAPGTAIPRIRALHHPAFPHRKEAVGALGPHLHLNAPARAILG